MGVVVVTPSSKNQTSIAAKRTTPGALRRWSTMEWHRGGGSIKLLLFYQNSLEKSKDDSGVSVNVSASHSYPAFIRNFFPILYCNHNQEIHVEYSLFEIIAWIREQGCGIVARIRCRNVV